MSHVNHLDPRDPFVLDTHELGRRPGSMRPVHLTVPAPDGLGTEVIAVPPGSEIELDLRLEAVMEGVLVSGDVRASAAGECVRCLDAIVVDIEVELTELYVYPERARVAEEDGDEEDEVRELDGDLVDVEPAIRDTLVPALPFQPLCRPDCPGLCVECGAHLADDPDHRHDLRDPRWAALEDLQKPTDS